MRHVHRQSELPARRAGRRGSAQARWRGSGRLWGTASTRAAAGSTGLPVQRRRAAELQAAAVALDAFDEALPTCSMHTADPLWPLSSCGKPPWPTKGPLAAATSQHGADQAGCGPGRYGGGRWSGCIRRWVGTVATVKPPCVTWLPTRRERDVGHAVPVEWLRARSERQKATSKPTAGL